MKRSQNDHSPNEWFSLSVRPRDFMITALGLFVEGLNSKESEPQLKMSDWMCAFVCLLEVPFFRETIIHTDNNHLASLWGLANL